MLNPNTSALDAAVESNNSFDSPSATGNKVMSVKDVIIMTEGILKAM
jgi:hypothetical protein